MERLHAATVALALSLIVGLGATTATAQQTSTITQSDILQLQDSVYLAERDVTGLRSRDADLANRLQADLDDLRDEVIYLKVKLRKEGTLTRTEYAGVRDRIDGLRARTRTGTATSAAPPARSPSAPATGSATRSTPATPDPQARPSPGTAAGKPPAPTATTGGSASTPRPTTTRTGSTTEIPAGTELDVRLQQTLSSGTAMVEDRFEGTTLVDLNVEGRTLIPAGSVLRGIVSGVEPATRTNRTARLTLSFDQMTVGGRSYEIRGTVTEAIEGEGIKGEVGRIGAGAGVGAIIGGILGGFRGALAGILIGGGGIVAATEGMEVEVPQGTVLRVRLDSPVELAR